MSVQDVLRTGRLSGARAASGAARKTEEDDEPRVLTPEEERSLIGTAMDKSMGGLSMVGNFLDLPGSMVRDVLAGENPLDQVLSPFTDKNRTTGQELLQKYNLQSRGSSGTWYGDAGRWLAGFGAEVVLDPLTYATLGASALTKSGRLAQKAGLLDDAARLGKGGKRVSRMKTTLRELAPEGSSAASKLKAAYGKDLTDELLDSRLGGIGSFKLPGLNPLVVGKAGGRAEKVASAMDTVGEAVRFGKYSPVRGLAPVFQRAVRNAKTAAGQKEAMQITEGIESDIQNVRSMFYKDLIELEEGGVLRGEQGFENSLKMLDYLEDVEPPKPPEIKEIARKYNELEEQVMSPDRPFRALTGEAQDELRRPLTMPEADFEDYIADLPAQEAAELTARREALSDLKEQRRLEYEEAGYDYRPQLDESLEPHRQLLDRLKGSMRTLRDIEVNSGVSLQELDDPISYFPRLRQSTGGPMRRARDNSSFKPSDAFALGREESLRGMLRGTALLQRMSVDKRFAGAARRKGWNKNVQDELRREWRREYGLVIDDETMFDGAEWQRRTDQLFNKITKLDPDAVDRGIPMFATNPVETAIRRWESGMRAAQTARGVRRFLAGQARVVPGQEEGETLLTRIMGTTQSSDINQGHKRAKELMLQDLGKVADDARQMIFEERKPALLDSMVTGQLQSMGVDKLPQTAAQRERALLDMLRSGVRPANMTDEQAALFDETAGVYKSADEFFGTDWQEAELAKIKPDEILGRISVPDDIAKDATRVVNGFKGPQAMEELVAAADVVTNWFKTNVTATAPSFHTRNKVSGVVANVLAGAIKPLEVVRYEKGALDLLRGKKTKLAKEIFPEMSEEAATSQLRKEAFAMGILDSPGQHNDLVADAGGDVARQIPGMRSIGDQFKSPEGTKRWEQFAPWKTAGAGDDTDRFFLARWGRGIGDVVEGGNRMSAYMSLRKNGWSPKAAARRVKEIHVDYNNLSDIERRGIRRLFPFYSFLRGQVPFIVNELASRPGGALAQTVRATNRAKGTDVTTPQYVAETTAIPLGQLEDGSERYITGLGLMHEAPLSMIPSDLQSFGLNLLSQSNPIYKGPLEYVTGQTFFQQTPDGGRPLRDTDPLLGRLMSNVLGRDEAVKLPREVEMLAANSPLTRYLSTARQLTDPRKGAGAKSAAFLLGPRFTDVSPAAQDAILREQADYIMRDMGARDFVQTYLPDRVMEAMTPAQREQAEQWVALQRMLALRTKARRKAKEEAAETDQ